MLTSQNQVNICNRALALTGISSTISALDENSGESHICTQYFESTYEAFLAEHAWRFANRTVYLNLIDTEIYPLDIIPGWRFSYQYPGDCLRLLVIKPKSYYFRDAFGNDNDFGLGSWREDRYFFPLGRPVPNYDTMLGTTGRIIVCNFPEPVAIYTSSAVPNQAHPAIWLEAFTYRLASNMVFSLRGTGESVAQQLLQIHVRLKSQAIAVDSGEGNEYGNEQPFLDQYRPEAGVIR